MRLSTQQAASSALRAGALRRVRRAARARQKGLSIVELMVGVAVGLIVVAAATLMVTTQLVDNRRLMQEMQLQQDLRATADLIARDLRRAGYWKDAERATMAGLGAGRLGNPYAAVSPASAAGASDAVTFTYAHPDRLEDNAVNDDEQLGFRLNSGVIESQLGDENWQALTDGGVLRVTRLVVTPQEQPVTLPCHLACSAGATPCPPVQTIRAYTVDIGAQAVGDASVVRSIRTHVRLRNDLVVGECRD